eukprot:607837_1
MATLFTLWCIGRNVNGQFGIGNDNAQKQLMKCGWSETIQIRNIYASNRGYTMVEDMNGNYYSAGYNSLGACTLNDESNNIVNITPITYFKQNNIKISHVFVSNRGDAPFWKTDDGSIYTSCNSNYRGRIGVEVYYKTITKIPFLSQFSIKKMVSGDGCSIAICNDGSVYSTGHGFGEGDNGLGEEGKRNESWQRIEGLKDIIDCDFGYEFVIFLSSSGRVFSAGSNNHGQLGLNMKDKWGHILRNPTEIECFPDTNASEYMKAMTDELKRITHLPDDVVDVIIVHLPSVAPIVSIGCLEDGVVALDCSGNVYQWGRSLSGGSDILCPQQIKLEENVVSIETGMDHCICRTERGHFISIGSGDYGECCRDNVDDESPQIINEWILNQINSKEVKILSVIPGEKCTFILVSNADDLSKKDTIDTNKKQDDAANNKKRKRKDNSEEEDSSEDTNAMYAPKPKKRKIK